MKKEHSNGATAGYYELPAGATQLQDLISDRDMNAQIGEVFRACYRYGRVSHSDKIRDAKKILFYAQAEVKRLEMLAEEVMAPADPVAAAPLSVKVIPDVARNCATCGHPSASTCDRCDTSYSHWSPR